MWLQRLVHPCDAWCFKMWGRPGTLVLLRITPCYRICLTAPARPCLQLNRHLAPAASLGICTSLVQVPVWIRLVFTPQGVSMKEVKEVLILKSWHWWKPRTPGSYPLFCSLCFLFCQRQADAAIVACKWGVAMTWLEHGSQQWSIFRSLTSCQMKWNIKNSSLINTTEKPP